MLRKVHGFVRCRRSDFVRDDVLPIEEAGPTFLRERYAFFRGQLLSVLHLVFHLKHDQFAPIHAGRQISKTADGFAKLELVVFRLNKITNLLEL